MSMRCDNIECPENGVEKPSWEIPADMVVTCGVCATPCAHLPDRPEDDPFAGAAHEPTPVQQWHPA